MSDAAAAPSGPHAVEQISANKHFGGYNRRYRHQSQVLGCPMTFSVYYPPAAEAGQQVPVLYWLSGLTCTDENFIQKSGAQRAAAAHGIALIAPDTSPRGLNVEGESESWDFGVGAGFYLNATQPKWAAWCMEDYVMQELPAVLAANFSNKLDLGRAGLSGHSMGGHGALTLGLKYPARFRSLSAFSPICNPTAVPWGIKAFTGYLGDADKEAWKRHDAVELLKSYHGPHLPLLVDVGSADSFFEVQLQPHKLEQAAAAAGYPATVRIQDSYDHSYFFVSTFIEEHIEHHAKALKH